MTRHKLENLVKGKKAERKAKRKNITGLNKWNRRKKAFELTGSARAQHIIIIIIHSCKLAIDRNSLMFVLFMI